MTTTALRSIALIGATKEGREHGKMVQATAVLAIGMRPSRAHSWLIPDPR
jgi:hypothetical protein